MRLDVDLGFNLWRYDQSYRLLRVNAPELNTAEGVAARDALAGHLAERQAVAGADAA